MVDEKKEKSGEEGKKEEKETESKDAEKNNDDGDATKKKGTSKRDLTMVEEAKAAAKEIRDANAETRELLDRKEKLAADEALGGKSQMNVPDKPKTADEKYKEDAKKRYEGTGMDPT
jgi:hypothetical protein